MQLFARVQQESVLPGTGHHRKHRRVTTALVGTLFGDDVDGAVSAASPPDPHCAGRGASFSVFLSPWFTLSWGDSHVRAWGSLPHREGPVPCCCWCSRPHTSCLTAQLPASFLRRALLRCALLAAVTHGAHITTCRHAAHHSPGAHFS